MKAIVQAIPTYIMSCFLLLERLGKKITKIVRQFQWGQKGDEKRVCQKNWNSMCSSKEEGGIRFRNMTSFDAFGKTWLGTRSTS